jgi:hypothetical protein
MNEVVVSDHLIHLNKGWLTHTCYYAIIATSFEKLDQDLRHKEEEKYGNMRNEERGLTKLIRRKPGSGTCGSKIAPKNEEKNKPPHSRNAPHRN